MEKYDFPKEVKDFKPLILKRIKVEGNEKRFESVVWIEECGNFIYWITPNEYLDLKSNYEILKAILSIAYQESIKTLWTFAPVELTFIYEKLKFKKGRKEAILSFKI